VVRDRVTADTHFMPTVSAVESRRGAAFSPREGASEVEHRYVAAGDEIAGRSCIDSPASPSVPLCADLAACFACTRVVVEGLGDTRAGRFPPHPKLGDAQPRQDANAPGYSRFTPDRPEIPCTPSW
jgi:hypothetical protein